MARVRMKGLDEYMQHLQRVEKNTPELIGEIVYNMADIVADEVRKNIEELEAVPDTDALKAYKEKDLAKLTVSEKKGLEQGFGIAPMKNEDGFVCVKLGFDGYNEIKTKKYPKGQPNVVIARAVESGSSVRGKTPFVRPAVNKTRRQAEEKAKAIIDERISESIKK